MKILEIEINNKTTKDRVFTVHIDLFAEQIENNGSSKKRNVFLIWNFYLKNKN